MSSISSMPYAVRKTDSGWIKETAKKIRGIRLQYQSTPSYYNEIKDSFRCYGCYKTWEEKYRKEPHQYDLPTLTHYIYKNDETHFKLRRLSQEKHHEHIESCYFKDPTNYYKKLSNRFDYIQSDKKQTARLTILNQLKQALTKEKTPQQFHSNKTYTNKINYIQSFGALQNIYNRYQDSWKELNVITEDNENKKIEDLLRSPIEATQLAKSNENKIVIVHGIVEKVEHRNNGGFINILFKQGSSESSHPFRLSISPFHIYNKEDLKCLENRKIGCYGRLGFNKGYSQMELFSLHHQIVFLDLQENELCPFTLPAINFERLHNLITQTIEIYNGKAQPYNPGMFTYYFQRQANISQLEKQFQQDKRNKESLLQEKTFKVQQRKEVTLQHEQLLIHQANTRKQLTDITSKIETEQKRFNNKLRKLIRNFYNLSESQEIQELVSKQNILRTQLNSYKEQEKVQQKNIMYLDDSISAIESSIKNLDKNLSNLLESIKKIKQGLHTEKVWKSHLEQENCFLYHHSMENMWIAIQINQNQQHTSNLTFTCSFLYHYENNTEHIQPEKMANIQFDTPSYDLMIYKIIQNKLYQSLTRSPIQKYRVKNIQNESKCF
ncbi:hypothetical protein [Bacillus cereus group sp. BfR-BA-01380]|uniref:hypothetical protein n=1 Tax=Bacillus cereus group sp. BfR-BA-01380 TaxID=2920324 RepID=UPI001F564BA8|nr:hypothetical protein [Bacillus cereus group sp. BfR-BA-01380]